MDTGHTEEFLYHVYSTHINTQKKHILIPTKHVLLPNLMFKFRVLEGFSRFLQMHKSKVFLSFVQKIVKYNNIFNDLFQIRQ